MSKFSKSQQSEPSFFSRYWLLLSIVALAFILRLYKITSEPLDWHAFRQADTASVTREYVKHGIDLLVPHYQDLSNIQSGRDNLQGYRMVEFPFLNAAVAVLVKYSGAPLVATSRMESVLFSLGTIVALYFLVENLSGKKTAYLTALLFGILPYSVYYSRVILPEPAMDFFLVYSFLGFYLWLEKKNWGWYVASFISLALGLLLKPSLVFVLPVYPALILFHEMPVKKWTVKFVFEKVAYYFLTLTPAFLVAAAPFYFWRQWIAQFPSGIPAFDWLFNSNGIRFRPAWFRWLFWERLTKLIDGYIGILFFPINFFKFNKDLIVYGSWWIGILAYFAVIATGNVQHDYYQVFTVPIVCISFARGCAIVYDFLAKHANKNIAAGLVGVGIIASVVLSWQLISGYYNINHPEYIVAGQAVDKLTPPDALVIAPAFGDTQFLFQTNRRGWPIGFEIEDKIAKGAQYYVSTSYDDEARRLESQYQVMEKNNTFILIDLTHKKDANAK